MAINTYTFLHLPIHTYTYLYLPTPAYIYLELPILPVTILLYRLYVFSMTFLPITFDFRRGRAINLEGRDAGIYDRSFSPAVSLPTWPGDQPRRS